MVCGAAAVSAIAARSDHGYCLLSSEKVSYFFAEGESLEECCEGKVLAEPRGIFLDAFQVSVFVAREERFVHRFHFAHFAEEDNFPGELSFVLVKVRFFLDVDPNCGRGDGALRRGGPWPGLRDEHGGVGRSHTHPGV